MKKIVITFGLIGGVLVSGLMYLTMPHGKEQADFENGEILGYLSMIIALSTIFFGIKILRDKHQGGKITFKRGFVLGLYITLVASALYIISWEIYYQTIAKDFMDQYMNYSMEKLKSSGASSVQIQEQQAQMETMKEWYKIPVIRFGFTFMEIFPVGLVISLISAAILRKKEILPAA
jgi:hypothetical protein